MAAMFVVPILTIGEPHYPTSEWRRVVLAVGVASLVGYSVQALIAEIRSRRAAAEERSVELATASASLEAALAFQRQLLDSSAQVIIATDPEGRIVQVNAAVEPVLGWTADELLGRVTTHPADGDGHSIDGTPGPDLAEILAELPPGGFEERDTLIAAKDGSLIPVALSVTPIRGAGGQPSGFLVVARDVREERRLRADLEQREAFLSSVMAATPDMIAITDVATGASLFRNAAVLEMLGEAATSNRTRLDLIHDDDRARMREAMAHAVEEGQASARIRLNAADASIRWLDVRVRRLGGPGSSQVVSIARDVTDQVTLDEALVVAHRAAEAASDAKTRFLATMSHELRTPLNSILGFGQILESGAGSALARKHSGYIVTAGRHLQSLIGDLIDISAIEADRLDLELEAVEIGPLLEEVLTLLRSAAAAAGVELTGPQAAPWPPVRADRRRLRQALINLINNAVKFNRRGGFVAVSVDERDARVTFRIQDSAGGIAEADMARIFAPFERLERTSSRVEGSGLGLAVTKRLVEAMGGSIGVESEPGVGSTFWIVLDAEGADGSATEPERATRDAGGQLAGSWPIVQVEDNAANAALIEAMLRHRPAVELVTAVNGTDGLALVRERIPRLVLLDLDLPDISGDVVLSELRADPRTKDVPVIILSADASPDRIARLRAAGARAYLPKPVDFATLLALVDAEMTRAGPTA